MANESPDPKNAPPAAPSSGGLAAWLPLLLAIVLMPALAWATTQFLLLPKLQAALGNQAPAAGGSPASGGEHEANPAGGHEAATAAAKGHGATKKPRQTYPMSKVIVNLSGSLGTRYLMTSVTLVGDSPDFKTAIEENRDKLLDVANGTLASKTINDIERPGARNQIRAELIAVFNNALGAAIVQEIYFTEFAIQ